MVVRRFLRAAGACAAFLAVSPAARATFPGDNGAIAFVRGGDIWSISQAGTGERQLTSGPAADRNPEWSPDGRTISFDRGGKIMRMKADGSGVGELFPGVEPQVSADGRRLAYSVGSEVRIAALDGSGDELVDDHVFLADLDDWAPNHSLLLLTLHDGDASFMAQSSAGVSFGFALHDDRHLNNHQPSWSPDGTRIAFSTGLSGISGCFDDPTCPPDPDIGIRTMDVGGADLRTVHAGGTDPAWSPDGKRIAYVNGDRETLQIIHADGTNKRTLTKGGEPDWQPLEPKPPEPKVIHVPGPERVVTVQVPGPERVVEKVRTRTVAGAVEKCDVSPGKFTLVLRAHRRIRAGVGLKVTVDLGTMKATVKKGKRVRLKAGVR